VRTINTERITTAVARLCIEANTSIGCDVLGALRQARDEEESSVGRWVLDQILTNHQLARETCVPACQDTGMVVAFVEVGQDVHIEGGRLQEAVNAGVARGYKEGFLRSSVVDDPLRRVNTGDNTPAVIHIDLVPGDRLKITIAPKGGGSENMSAFKMLTPAAGRQGVVDFVLKTVEQAGANPCPPVIVGVGLGGNFEMAPYLAKKALLRKVGSKNPDARYARLESELLAEVNQLGIGPQGLGGTVTALAVHIEAYPCHITGIPVAVNMNCHAARHKSVVL